MHVVGAVLLVAVLLAWLFFFLGALFGAIGSRYSGGMKLVWCVLILVAPFIGSLLWYLIGRPNSHRTMA